MIDTGKHRLLFLVITGLVVLLPFLAALQYHWLGQLSSSEVDRKRSSLQTSAIQFGHAINNEIYPAQWAFRVSFTHSLDEISRQLRSGYLTWYSRTSHPDIIESVYWVDYDAERDLQLFEFDTASGALSPTPWPEHLSGWHTYFIERTRRQLEYYQPTDAQSIRNHSEERAFLDLSGQLMTERPAIIIPVSIDSDLESENLFANLNATSTGRAGHTLITLNTSYLIDSFFPDLADTLIYSIEKDVDLLIVSNSDSSQAIYKSHPDLNISHFKTADARQKIGLFRWMPFTSASRLASGYASLLERDQLIADSLVGQIQRAITPSATEDFTPSSATFTDYPVQAIIQLAEEEHYEGELTAEHLAMALSRLRDEPDAPLSSPTVLNTTPTPPASPSDQAWMLLLQHKRGSLETVVQANQRKNLILSFGILGILGIAILFIYISSQRARTLAERQMSFVAGVSHELRTPLAVILSASQNLADGVVSKPDRLKQYGELISQEGRRLTDMIEHVLELAGIQSGKKQYVKENIPVQKLIDDVLASWEKTIQKKDFDVTVHIEPELPEISGDVRSLQMTLGNLISNAIKYSNGHRSITINAYRYPERRHRELRIAVSDKGKGIPDEEKNRIFEEFYRGADVTQAQIHGNGIGLSLVKKTMEAHQGKVTVESERNKGSTFTLHFPA